MRLTVKQYFLTLVFIFVLVGVSFFGSQAAQAALVPCGGAGNPCTACHFVVLGKNILNFLMNIVVVVAITLITAMGVLYIVSAGNEGLIKRAKDGLKAVLIGVVIMLSAWLIVSTILSLVASESFITGSADFLGIERGPGTFGLQCSTTSLAGSVSLQGGTSSIVGGTCNATTSGLCGTARLSRTCFNGPFVDTWSAICYNESHGSATASSGTDKCTVDGSVVSFGLFQINISANKVGGLNCPQAFNHPYTGSTKDCRVINQDLYNRCKAAAQNVTNNMTTACSLAGSNRNNTSAWGAARRCNIPKTL